MIDARNPVARAVRPIVAERGPASLRVGSDHQAVGHLTAVCHRDANGVALTRRQRNVNDIGSATEAHYLVVDRDGRHREADEIEGQRVPTGPLSRAPCSAYGEKGRPTNNP